METIRDVINALTGQDVVFFLVNGKELGGKIMKAGKDFVSVSAGGDTDSVFYVPFNAITHFKRPS